ncbi:MAG: SRPBCC family protein [Rhizomicrobium sp.]
MNPPGIITRTKDGGYVLTYERKLDKPPAQVWAALTDPAILKRWLDRSDVDLRVGGKFVIYFFDGKETMSGVIQALEHERLVEYTWNEEDNPESVVRWTIVPEGDGCRLTLIHILPRGSGAGLVIELGGGWHSILDNLASGLRGVQVVYDEPKLRALEAQYRELFVNSAAPNEYAQSSKVLSVRFERLVPGPIDRVWRYLTDATLLPGWFGNGKIEPRAGGAVSLMDGHIRGVVTQWHPPHRLSYTWNVFGPGDGPDAVSAYPESYLSFTLEARGSDVVLKLSHMPVLERFEKQNAMGWHTFLDMLGSALRGEKLEERGFYSKKNAALYGVDMNNLAR